MKKGIEWQLFPKNLTCPTHLKEVIDVFSSKIDSIDSTSHKKLESNAVLAFLADGLTSIGYDVEKSKKAEDFAKVATFMDTLYSSNRLSLPLKGVLIIGY